MYHFFFFFLELVHTFHSSAMPKSTGWKECILFNRMFLSSKIAHSDKLPAIVNKNFCKPALESVFAPIGPSLLLCQLCLCATSYTQPHTTRNILANQEHHRTTSWLRPLPSHSILIEHAAVVPLNFNSRSCLTVGSNMSLFW